MLLSVQRESSEENWLDKTRQDKTFIIVTLQVQLFGTQLARKR